MFLSCHFGQYVIFSAGSVSLIYPFLRQQPMIDVIFPTFLLFLFSFNGCVYYYYSDLLYLQSFVQMYVLEFHVPLLFFLMLQDKEQQSYSLQFSDGNQKTSCILPPCVAIIITNYFKLHFKSFSQTVLLYYIFDFIFQDDQQAKFMADTCGWGSLPVRFKIFCLESFGVCAPPQNIMSSILLVVINLSRVHFY